MTKCHDCGRPAVPGKSRCTTHLADPAAAALRDELIATKRQLAKAQKAEAELARLAEAREAASREVADIKVPDWLERRPPPDAGPGVPTVLCSDWHGGEGVLPSDVGGRNAYSPEIFTARAKRLLNTSVDLLKNHMVRPNYPGIVVPLAGDMLDHLNRWVHSAEPGNPVGTRSAMNLVTEAVCALVEGYASAFGHVFVPCVTGNHGRLTAKQSHVQRSEENLDAMLYDRVKQVMDRDSVLRRRVKVVVASGTDLRWHVYGHRYLLLHGDPASMGSGGGDGIIGALGPIARGDKRTRARNSQIDRSYDTLVMGHYHQWTVVPGVIVNGSLKGYDAYAYSHGFPYEPPRQAMWLTHPKWGITCHWPVYVDAIQTQTPDPKAEWIGLDALYAE